MTNDACTSRNLCISPVNHSFFTQPLSSFCLHSYHSALLEQLNQAQALLSSSSMKTTQKGTCILVRQITHCICTSAQTAYPATIATCGYNTQETEVQFCVCIEEKCDINNIFLKKWDFSSLKVTACIPLLTTVAFIFKLLIEWNVWVAPAALIFCSQLCVGYA